MHYSELSLNEDIKIIFFSYYKELIVKFIKLISAKMPTTVTVRFYNLGTNADE